MKYLKDNQQGFTIIEVMIVLAIASVILLGVLLVVPALQRSGRNSARARDAASLSTTLNNYRSSFNKLPDHGASVKWTDGGTEYDLGGVKTAAMVYYSQIGTCNPSPCTADALKVVELGNTADLIDLTAGKKINSTTAGEERFSDDLSSEKILIITSAECVSSAVPSSGSDQKDLIQTGSINGAYAIIYQLEGDDAINCLDNV